MSPDMFSTTTMCQSSSGSIAYDRGFEQQGESFSWMGTSLEAGATRGLKQSLCEKVRGHGAKSCVGFLKGKKEKKHLGFVLYLVCPSACLHACILPCVVQCWLFEVANTDFAEEPSGLDELSRPERPP